MGFFEALCALPTNQNIFWFSVMLEVTSDYEFWFGIWDLGFTNNKLTFHFIFHRITDSLIHRDSSLRCLDCARHDIFFTDSPLHSFTVSLINWDLSTALETGSDERLWMTVVSLFVIQKAATCCQLKNLLYQEESLRNNYEILRFALNDNRLRIVHSLTH